MTSRILKNELIPCMDLTGMVHEIPAEEFKTRVSAYGLVRQQNTYGKVLFVHMKISGKYFLPGGRIELCESIEDGLKAEIREETGIKVEVANLLGHLKTQYYDQRFNVAYDNLSLFYRCIPLSIDLISNPEEVVIPVWMPLMSTLKREKFQYPLTGGYLEGLINVHMNFR